MRRAWAILLLAIFGFSPVAPAVFADDSSSLPACCRRFGQHHCSMLLEDSGGPSLKGVCPNYSRASAVPASPIRPEKAAFTASGLNFSLPAAHSSLAVGPASAFSAVLDLSQPGRGPPSLSL